MPTSMEVDDSFGNDEPMGSEICEHYLYEGTGKPWAGQFKDKDCPPCSMNPVVTILDGNFGAEDPTAPNKQYIA